MKKDEFGSNTYEDTPLYKGSLTLKKNKFYLSTITLSEGP